jgi:hypothetical protein
VPTVRLGRDQQISLDGVVLEGTREFDFDIDMQTHDVTSWWHGWKSTLPVAADVTIRLLIYWGDTYGTNIGSKLNKHPPERMDMSITNVGFAPCVPTKVSIKTPIDGVMAWDVTMKLWTYD